MPKRITKINGYYLKDQELTNQLTQMANDLVKKLVLEGNKLYLAKDDGTKIDTGVVLPTSSGEQQSVDLSPYQKTVDAVMKTTIESGKIYLTKSDGTKIDSGTSLPTSSTSEPVDLSPYQTKNDATLNTAAKTIAGAINELKNSNDSIKDKFTTQSTETKISLNYNSSEVFSLPIVVEDDSI